MATVNVRLFGRFSAESRELSAPLEARKVQELLCFLLLRRERPHFREALAGLLWTECPSPQSRSYLRKALWQLQTALDSTEDSAPRLLALDEEWVQINPRADLWLDVAEFERAHDGCRGTTGGALSTVQAEALRGAVGLYRGNLLEGCYQDWLLFERERLQQMYIRMLDKLMGYCEGCGDYEEGFRYGTLTLGCDQARERTHQRLMRLYYLAGDRTAALRQYDRCVAVLEHELGVKPDDQTARLFRQIRANQRLQPAHPAEAPSSAKGTATSGVVRMLEPLRRAQFALADAQLQLQQDIQAIESTLEDFL